MVDALFYCVAMFPTPRMPRPWSVQLAEQEFGGLDGAFKNAGIVGDMTPIAAMTLENRNSVVAVNLTSAFHAAQAQIPALQRRGGGARVFTSSFFGFSNGGLPGMSAYAATKAGMNGLVQSLAAEHASEGIRVNALLPGGAITPAGGEGNYEVLAFVSRLHPIKRMAQPKEIAQAALFMLSADGRNLMSAFAACRPNADSPLPAPMRPPAPVAISCSFLKAPRQKLTVRI